MMSRSRGKFITYSSLKAGARPQSAEHAVDLLTMCQSLPTHSGQSVIILRLRLLDNSSQGVVRRARWQIKRILLIRFPEANIFSPSCLELTGIPSTNLAMNRPVSQMVRIPKITSISSDIRRHLYLLSTRTNFHHALHLLLTMEILSFKRRKFDIHLDVLIDLITSVCDELDSTTTETKYGCRCGKAFWDIGISCLG
jgi:hypothetical protein